MNRQGLIKPTRPHRIAWRVAVVFYGKVPGSQNQTGAPTRSLWMLPHDTASLELFNASRESWARALFAANDHVHFSVFVHSWSPEARQLFTDGYGSQLMGQQHEPTQYVDHVSAGLAFKCGIWQVA